MQLNMCVSLLPSDIGDIYAGIRRNIYQFLMRYNEALGGVLLAVSELSFGNGAREGRIEDEMPHIHFDVKAKAQVFRPRPGHVLEGRVNKVGTSGCRRRPGVCRGSALDCCFGREHRWWWLWWWAIVGGCCADFCNLPALGAVPLVGMPSETEHVGAQ